jgi:hypothetical protein
MTQRRLAESLSGKLHEARKLVLEVGHWDLVRVDAGNAAIRLPGSPWSAAPGMQMNTHLGPTVCNGGPQRIGEPSIQQDRLGRQVGRPVSVLLAERLEARDVPDVLCRGGCPLRPSIVLFSVYGDQQVHQLRSPASLIC